MAEINNSNCPIYLVLGDEVTDHGSIEKNVNCLALCGFKQGNQQAVC